MQVSCRDVVRGRGPRPAAAVPSSQRTVTTRPGRESSTLQAANGFAPLRLARAGGEPFFGLAASRIPLSTNEIPFTHCLRHSYQEGPPSLALQGSANGTEV